ncbi:uncharacterized protein [Channa argus]|uniref:uncharacterized protein isoform X2 n=1 Tax=Channa argus TaxID=215402 RepID=UPI0035216941
MLHPLIYLAALSLLAGPASADTFSGPGQNDISLCPITFYGKMYTQLYVSFTSDKVAICFDNFFNPDVREDCILGPLPSRQKTELQILKGNANNEQQTKQALPSIKTSESCLIKLTFLYDQDQIRADLTLINFGTQAAVSLSDSASGTFEFQVNGETVDTLTITNSADSQQALQYLDISGCRYSGVIFKPDSLLSSDPNTCTTVTCSSTAEVTTTGCGTLETCQGNNICIVDQICTVTGPTFIKFDGQLNSIQDRCAYSLLSVSSIPGMRLVANFQERRRKDVSFLDNVTVFLEEQGVQINLEQGRRVRVDGSVLTFTSSFQVADGVVIFKDDTGVTAEVSVSIHTVSVFFDGYTAQIHLEGPGGNDLSVQGLCGTSSEFLDDLKLSQYSANGCEIPYSDTPDSSINCTTATQFCNLLREDPFKGCHNVTDPMPYITACTETLCKYPSVDGVNCEFLGAYVRACSLREIIITNDWRSLADCSPPLSLCQDRTCTANEFCGERLNNGQSGCLCRALFASNYRERNTLGDPPVCGPNSASLALVGCLLEEKGVDYSALHLFDPACKGQIDEQTHMVTFTYDNINTCGTEVTANGSQVIYTNAITNLNNNTDVIIRRDQVFINFTCVQTQPDVKTMSFKIKESSVIVHITSGAWNYDLTMNTYVDSERTQVLGSNTEVLLDQRIWVELDTHGLDELLVSVVTDSCWATADPSPTGALRYNLIINGCPNPNDPTVKVYGNGDGTSNYFAFNMFQFTGHSGDIYLHCNLQLCVKNCVPACDGGARRRRSLGPKYESEHSALISMAWVN